MTSGDADAARKEANLHVSHMIIDGLAELGATSEETAVSVEVLQEHMHQRIPAGAAGRYYQALNPDAEKTTSSTERHARVEEGQRQLVTWFTTRELPKFGLHERDGKYWLDQQSPPRIHRPGRSGRVPYSPGEDALSDRRSMQQEAGASIVADLDRILGPIDESIVASLVKSMRRKGYITQFPIVKDTAGHVIAGRHRNQAAALAGVAPEVVTFNGSAIEAAYVALADTLERRHLNPKQVKAIEKAFRDAGYDWDQIVRDWDLDVPVRDRIRAELLANHKRPDSTIAKIAGDDHTVRTVREEMEGKSEIPIYRVERGRISKITDQQLDEIDALDLGYPQIMERYKVGQTAAQNAKTKVLNRRKERARPAQPEPEPETEPQAEQEQTKHIHNLVTQTRMRAETRVICDECGDVLQEWEVQQ